MRRRTLPHYPVILPLSREDQELLGRKQMEAQRRRAREALVQSCVASGLPCGPFDKDARNVPRPFSGNYWSISHKPRYVAAVVSSTPIGIDLEEITPRNTSLFGRVAEEWEWQLAGDRGWETFFRYWTAKEAVLKATGVGLSHLKYARIQRILDADRLIVQYGDRLWPIQQYRFQNHIVSLTNGEEIRWTLSDR